MRAVRWRILMPRLQGLGLEKCFLMYLFSGALLMAWMSLGFTHV